MKTAGALHSAAWLGALLVLGAFALTAASHPAAASSSTVGAGSASPQAAAGSSDEWMVAGDSVEATGSSPSTAGQPSIGAPSTGPISAALSKTATVTVDDSTPAQHQEDSAGVPASSTTEIPPALSSSFAADGAAEPAGTSSASDAGPIDYDGGVIRYEQAKNPELSGPPLGSLQDFLSGAEISVPLGIEVREAQRKLKGGEEAEGLLIVEVNANSPAARAGLHAYHRAVRDALETAAVAGSLFFPPAVLFVPVLDQVHIGESYDLIIGVDGARVTNLLDFEDRLREVQPGEIVYLSVIRDGERKQISVQVPAADALSGPSL